MTPLFLLGLLLGVRHALDADHVAAVAAMATRSRSLRDHVRLASLWGIGHGGTLIVFGAVIVTLGLELPESIASGLELAVGLMLVLLGGNVLRRLYRERLHVHTHRHGDHPHLHVHSHRDDPLRHDPVSHEHEHRGGALRSLLVGSVHGLAGSAALIVLTLESASSTGEGLVLLAVFSIGSVLGMILFSAAISLPLRFSARRLGGAARPLEATVGAATVALGCWIVSATIAAWA